jgi:antitoxin component YwqK of YwqJK toxin-antitoxin module
MKNLVSLFILFFFLTNSYSQTQLIEYSEPIKDEVLNQEVVGKGFVDNNLIKNGEWNFFFKEKLVGTGFYENGKKRGIWTYYQPNREILAQISYENGLKIWEQFNKIWNGKTLKRYYENGNLSSEYLSHFELPEGQFHNWIGITYNYDQIKKVSNISSLELNYEKSGPVFEGNVNGLGYPEGFWKIFFPSGRTYIEGQINTSKYEPNRNDRHRGQIAGKKFIRPGFKNLDGLIGILSNEDSGKGYSGIALFFSTYQDFFMQIFSNNLLPTHIRDGKWIEYFENGKPQFEYNYNIGELNGPLIEYYTNGIVKSRSEFINNKLNGLEMTYFENGKISSEGKYLVNNDRSHKFDVWKYYSEDGSIKLIETYVIRDGGSMYSGKLDPVVQQTLEYYPNGNVKIEKFSGEGDNYYTKEFDSSGLILRHNYVSYMDLKIPGSAYPGEIYKNMKVLNDIRYFYQSGKLTQRVNNQFKYEPGSRGVGYLITEYFDLNGNIVKIDKVIIE